MNEKYYRIIKYIYNEVSIAIVKQTTLRGKTTGVYLNMNIVLFQLILFRIMHRNFKSTTNIS